MMLNSLINEERNLLAKVLCHRKNKTCGTCGYRKIINYVQRWIVTPRCLVMHQSALIQCSLRLDVLGVLLVMLSGTLA